MKYILLIVLVMTSSSVFSQQYMPFPKDSTSWIVRSTDFNNYMGNTWLDRFFVEGDTIIDGRTFIELFTERDYNIQSVGFLFQDSTYEKLYLEKNNNYKDSLLVYDLGLEVGQSVEFLNFYQCEVREIDTIMVGGLSRKRIVLDYNYDGDIHFIEGIGTNLGFNPSDYLSTLNSEVLCCKIGEETVYPLDDLNNKCELYTSLYQDTFEKESLVYPNPFTENLIIQPNLLGSNILTIKLFNVLGELKYSKPVNFSEEIEINTSNFNSGVYFLILEKKDAPLLTRKIVKK